MTDISTSSKIRVGLIGAGNWANHGHLRVLELLPEYEVRSVYARRKEASEAAAKRFSIPTIADSVEMAVAQSDVDLVVVLNPPAQHADAVRTAIAAGKDVYCEWPFTVDTVTAEDLLRRARDAGVRHAIGLQRRLAPHTLYLRDLLAQGYVGKLRSARMHVSMNYFQATLPSALAWTAPPQNFSHVVAIYAGHFLDMLFQIVGQPRSLSALLANQFPAKTIKETGERIPSGAPDQLVLSGVIGNDIVLSVHVEGGKRNGSGVQIDITGDAGDLRIVNASAFGGVGQDHVITGAHGDNLSLEALTIPAGFDRWPASELPSSVLELANLYAAFARDRKTGTKTAPDFEDAVRLHRLFDAMTTSSARGVRVDVGCAQVAPAGPAKRECRY